MKGLPLKAVKAVENAIKNQFDKLSLSLLGIIPKKTKDKKIIFSASKNNIMSLFFQSLNTKKPNLLEEDTLSTMMRIATGYIDALRDRTASRVVQDIDGYVRNQNMKKQDISGSKVKEMMNKEMDKAKNHFKMIANAESNKAINMGTALQISKLAEEKGEEDPVVFFVIFDDDRTGFYEYILHTLPDKVTPRLWRLSEISATYYQNGEQYPSLTGLHVNCRCRLTYLSKGYSFKNGKVAFKSLDHDEFKIQRAKHGLPKVPNRPRKKNGQWVFPKNI